MAVYRKIVIKRGSIKTIRMQIIDANGAAVDLTGFTITAYATRPYHAVHIIDGTVTPLDQTTLKGFVDVEFDESAGTNPASSYDLEVKTINGNGDPEYFPCIEGHPFGEYIIVESKA